MDEAEKSAALSTRRCPLSSGSSSDSSVRVSAPTISLLSGSLYPGSAVGTALGPSPCQPPGITALPTSPPFPLSSPAPSPPFSRQAASGRGEERPAPTERQANRAAHQRPVPPSADAGLRWPGASQIAWPAAPGGRAARAVGRARCRARRSRAPQRAPDPHSGPVRQGRHAPLPRRGHPYHRRTPRSGHATTA